MAISRRDFFKGVATTAGVASLPVIAGCAAQNDPFLHGVASGDPLQDRVILWTRVTAYNDSGEIASAGQQPETIDYQWKVALEPTMETLVAQGQGVTSAERDYTVKVDVTGLTAGTTYYYQFQALGWYSQIGRTRTLPEGHVDKLRIAFTSCSNWVYGYFNVYRNIALRRDLDVVLHLGDYIYEYGQSYANQNLDRKHIPDHEIITLQDYRQRHAQYKTDRDAQAVHQQHPFIAIWDDHELANDAYKDGAENHNEALEGAWEQRRKNAVQAYFEWMPIRETDYNDLGEPVVYRDFGFGDLVDLIMLDTRLSGRTEQSAIGDLNTLNDPDHRLLDETQEQWLYQKLLDSKIKQTTWRVLGQQVMMGQLAGGAIGFNMDQWDGYPLSRERLFNHLIDNQIDNFVVLTGDIHSSWAMDLSPNPFSANVYDPHTGSGSIGVEFVSPAVSSPGIVNPLLAAGVSEALQAAMPHMKYVDFYRRGYVLLDITHERIQAEWHHVGSVNFPGLGDFFSRAYAVYNGEPGLKRELVQSEPIYDAPPFAPTLKASERVV